MLLGLIDGHGQHGDLHAGDRAAQEVEAGAADLDAAAHVDAGHAGAEGQVVFRLEAFGREVAGLADLLDDNVIVLAAFRGLGFDDVRQLPHGGGVFPGGGVRGGLVLGDLGGQLLGLRDQRGLLVGGRGGNLLADLLLLGAGSSNSLSAERRVSSERSTSSTSSTDSPRLRWDSLTMSACSRMN